MIDSLPDEPKDSLPLLLAEIERMVADWSIAETVNEAHEISALTKCVNEIASAHAVVGAAFSVLDPVRSVVVLVKTYEADFRNENIDIKESSRLFPYSHPNGVAEKYPRLTKALEESGMGFPGFIDSLFQSQRGGHRTDDPNSLIPEFLKSDLKEASMVTYDEILRYLTGWLYSLFCAASCEFGLQASNGNPDPSLTIGDAVLSALRNTPDHTKRYLKEFDDFNRYFIQFEDGKSTNRNPLVQLLLDCRLEDVLRTAGELHDFSSNANDFLTSLNVDLNSPFVNQLDSISRKASFPLIPYLCLVALFDRPIAHVTIPMHHTRAFKHQIVVDERETVQRSCGVFFLATVDASKVRIPELAVLAKAMSAPILDQIYYGGFQKLLAQKVGREKGVKSIQTSFGHQVKGLGQFYKYWLFEGAAPQTENIRWTPVPQLFEDLGQTLTFWGFGNTHEDIGIWDKNQAPEFFSTLLEIAADYANRKERAAYFSRQDPTGTSKQEEIRLKRPITLIFTKDCHSLSVNKRILNAVEKQKQSWRELTGLCRYFSVHFENAFEHREVKLADQTVYVEYKLTDDGKCNVVLANSSAPEHKKRERSQEKRHRFEGARGTDILAFIKETNLADLNIVEHETGTNSSSSTPYRMKLSFEVPQWMNRTK